MVTRQQIEDALRPRRPHDDLSFAVLARRYNFRLTSDRRRVFTNLVLRACRDRPSPVHAVDVGCGRGIGRHPEYLWAIRRQVDEFWGVEPDAGVDPPAGLFDEHRPTAIEESGLPSGYFDIAYSFMVMEHVTRPETFMSAVFDCLKPGGVYLMATPNRRHYFTRTASLLHTLGWDERILAWVKKGRSEEYHYPVAYRFNDAATIRRCATGIGFLAPEFAYLESRGPVGYVPGPLRPLFHLLALKRRLLRRPASLLTLLSRMTKPGAGSGTPGGTR